MLMFKKMWRTLGKYKAQVISMIIMIAIGVGIFFGFNIEWYSIKCSTDKFFENSNFADYKIYSQTGFTYDDKTNIDSINGVTGSTRALSVKVGVQGKEAYLALNAIEDYGISTFTLIDGQEYDKDIIGVWLSDQFAKENNYKVNSSINLVYNGVVKSLNIVGLIKSAEYMVCVDENQLMPKFESYGFCYVSPNVVKNEFGMEFYNQISIKSSLDKKQMENAVNTSLNKTILMLSLDENTSYQAAKSESEEGQTMGAILPVLFLLIAVLTMITTMHRITKNEKTQIGTLKALGFKDKRILWHYTSFGLLVGIIGSMIGIALGYMIAFIVVNPKGMLATYFDWPEWSLYMPWFCPLVLVLIIAFLTGVCLLSVKNILKGMPAETLRPYVPKHIKQTKLEKTKVWNKMSFGFKWNYRDTIRNTSRTIVTLIGVIGCVILIVGSLGMKDSMNGFMKTLDNTINYVTKINLTETVSENDINSLKSLYNADSVSQLSIKYNDQTTTLEIYSVNNGYVRFYDKNNKQLTLEDDGVYICLRLADKGVKVGDTISFSPYGSSQTYTVKVAGINRSVITETITMSENYAKVLGIDFKPTALFTCVEDKNIAIGNSIASVQSKKTLIKTYDTFMNILNEMVLILIVAALVLGVVVLYNLGVMSYIERYREFATLKVVGFKDGQIAKMLVGQNTWLSFIGTILGLPLGYGALYGLVKALANEYEMKVRVSIGSYILAFVLTIGVSLLVSMLIANKNKKIDMVEALKDKEN